MRFSCLLLLPLLVSCYVTKQAWHQGKLLASRRSITEVIAAPQTPAEQRQQLEFSQEVLAWAGKQGLMSKGAYRYFVSLNRNDISYLVQAAYSDRLEQYTWWFPVVGRVPYLGFFEQSERDSYAAELRSQGLDVYESTASAFSSLGWFDDPLYSTMLSRSKASLAALLFHELTHRTVWISGQAEFNEQLATFVETYLTRKFLQEHQLQDELTRYEALLSDEKQLATWLDQLKQALKDFYQRTAAHSPPLSQDLFSAAKQAIFARFVDQQAPQFRRFDLVGKEPWNNARVLAASNYQPDYQRFLASMQCSQAPTIGVYLAQLETAWNSAQQPVEPYTIVDQPCNPQGGGADERTTQILPR